MKSIIYDIKPAGWAVCKLLGGFFPGVRTSSLGGLSLREGPAPQLPGEDWVRVRTLMGGLCGTDLAILAQKQPPDSILQAFSSLPMGLGHENVAIVETLGAEVDRAWVGKRVCVEPTLCCAARGIEPACGPCRRGEFGACENFGADGLGKSKLPPGTSIGYNRRTGGSWGESFVAHRSQLVEVPAGLTDEQAILTDPLACGLHAVLRADLSEARQVLVYGAGVLGLGVISGLRAMGFAGRIDALDRAGYLESLARTLGADEMLHPEHEAAERFETIARRTGGKTHRLRFGNWMLSGGYDVVFDCVGSPQSIQESLKWTAARGQVVLVGTGHGGQIDLTPIWFRELRVTGAYGRQYEHVAGGRVGTYQLVHKLQLEGKLNCESLLTHRFILGEYRRALEVAMNKSAHQAIKVAFDFRRG